MKGWGILFALCFWACANRDNPYDPANIAQRKTDTSAWHPIPRPGVRVVLPDSGVKRNSPYYANIGTGLADLNPGDTLWVQGGRTYGIKAVLNLSQGGARLLPVVIRSFGGEARILAGALVTNCLRIDKGGVNVHITGFAFVGATAPAILVDTLPGDLWIDSCRIDTSGTAMQMYNITGKLHIHDVTMTADSLSPPVSFKNIGLLDTARLRW